MSSDTTSLGNLPLDTLAATANAYAAAHGVQIEKKNGLKSYFECAPISLLPNVYPQAAFAQAQVLAPAFNVLVDRISRDATFLQQTLGGGVAETDPYTAKLLQLYQEIYVNPTTASPHAAAADRLGIFRSDYMLHEQNQIKQVELNTIAASFAGLSTRVAAMHSFLMQRFGTKVQDFMQQNKQAVLGKTSDESGGAADGVPINPALERLPYAMHVTVERYKQRFQVDAPIVLFVVQEGETNTVDQRMLEFQLFQNHQIVVERRSLKQVYEQVRVDAETGALFLHSDTDQDAKEIALVYYRAGYAPTDYPDGYENGVEWQGRARLEASRATKCPNLGYHLAGTKKVQQELARPGVLERFFPHENEQDMIGNMRQAFAGLYSLGEDVTETDLAAVRDVLNGAHDRYVLKPQREGGGYNFYGVKLAQKINENVQETDNDKIVLDRKLSEYILMERLFPPQQQAILLRGGIVEGVGSSISELGCFGCIVVASSSDDKAEEVVHNEYAGFLLRTKFNNVDEGGVASGFATLSSPYLC